MTIHAQIAKAAQRKGTPLRFHDLRGGAVVIDLDRNRPTLVKWGTPRDGWRYGVECAGGMVEVSQETWREVREVLR